MCFVLLNASDRRSMKVNYRRLGLAVYLAYYSSPYFFGNIVLGSRSKLLLKKSSSSGNIILLALNYPGSNPVIVFILSGF
jgi:hypothetical protein